MDRSPGGSFLGEPEREGSPGAPYRPFLRSVIPSSSSQPPQSGHRQSRTFSRGSMAPQPKEMAGRVVLKQSLQATDHLRVLVVIFATTVTTVTWIPSSSAGTTWSA